MLFIHVYITLTTRAPDPHTMRLVRSPAHDTHMTSFREQLI